MSFLPGRIYEGRPTIDIHSQQSDRVARVDIEMDSSAFVRLVIAATRSAARHASKVDLQCLALANNSDFFTSALAPMSTASRPGWSIPLGPRTTSIQSLTSTQKNIYTYKSNVKSIKNEISLTFIPGDHLFYPRGRLTIFQLCNFLSYFWPM